MSSTYFLRIFVFLGLSFGAIGHLDLYLSTKETLRLLGVQAQLYYVHNGRVNQYALSFDLPLQSHIDDLYFTWMSLRESPPINYSLQFGVSNPRALAPPSTNISMTGVVPTSASVLAIHLPCTGSTSAEVHVTIKLVVNMTQEPTVLNFRRKKVCLRKNNVWNPKGRTPPGKRVDTRKDPKRPQPGGSIDESVNYPSIIQDHFSNNRRSGGSLDTNNNNNNGDDDGDDDDEEDEDSSDSTYIFYVAVACTCAVILIIALAVAGYYVTSKRSGKDHYSKKRNSYDSDSGISQALTGQSQTFLRPDTPNNVSGAGIPPGFRRGISPAVDLKPTDVNTVLTEILIDRKRISLGDLLLEGTFGRIYTGTLIGEDENEATAEQEVCIKTVTDQARPDQVQLFLSESILLKGLVHASVQPILGACLENPEQPLAVYPSLLEGNMKKFLLKCRMSECGSRYTLNTQQIVYMTIQMVRGVQYLHRKKLIHKDLATRNFMVDNDFVVKVSDNALARDLFPGDYNCLGDNENRPIKWMALEALVEKRFSPSTDVWAFGVTLWEMMTLGQQPYAEVDPFEMVSYLQEGYRIAKPHNCPDELFSLMACCWALSPDERPKLGQLLIYLQNFYMALGRYV